MLILILAISLQQPLHWLSLLRGRSTGLVESLCCHGRHDDKDLKSGWRRSFLLPFSGNTKILKKKEGPGGGAMGGRERRQASMVAAIYFCSAKARKPSAVSSAYV